MAEVPHAEESWDEVLRLAAANRNSNTVEAVLERAFKCHQASEMKYHKSVVRTHLVGALYQGKLEQVEIE
jgi:hypothetical protein